MPVNGPIPNEAMKTLCSKAKVKGALVLHRFNNDPDMDNDKSTRTMTEDGKEREYNGIYTVNYSSELQADWRFRGCDGQTYDLFYVRKLRFCGRLREIRQGMQNLI